MTTPTTDTKFDPMALLQIKGADPRSVTFAAQVLAMAAQGTDVSLSQWPRFAKDPAKLEATHAEPMYEGDANTLRNAFSRAAKAAKVTIGAGEGQINVLIRYGKNVVEFTDPATKATYTERVIDALDVKLVHKVAKAKALPTRPARF